MSALRQAIDQVIARIDDRTKYTQVHEHYRAGWVDALTTVRDDPAIVSLEALAAPLEPLRVIGATVHFQDRDHEDRDDCVACVASRPVLAALFAEGARRQAAGDPLT